jgi:hypothetical protein
MTGHADGRPDADPLNKPSNNRESTAHDSQKMHAESVKENGLRLDKRFFPKSLC